MRDRHLTPKRVADATGLTTLDFERLLSGDLGINLSTARALSDHLGATAAFWLTREAQYRDDLDRVHADAWSRALPLKQMSEWGWIAQPTTWKQRIAACLDYFDVHTVAEWDATYAAQVDNALFRTSRAHEHQTNATAVWFRACELQANRVTIQSAFTPKGFERALTEVRALTRQSNPTRFVPALVEACASAGVRLVVVRTPKGCTASGATRLYKGAPLISLSARHLSDDHFWFTFYHEAAHALMHDLTGPFIDSDDAEDATQDNHLEYEANRLVAHLLLGGADLDSRPQSYRQIIKIAQIAGISPGIVVGQLQNSGILGRNEHNSLKRWFAWNGTTLEKARTQ
ncbi:ImmA/IrrE family metallo-endopeptidase [Ruania rhizosphaerae]|uniref:ImmA/IrrE family metallo-endopeptidase n=1 Tax=Ruania rhizosphaerae TaxID=1840413 RepID=UPI001358FEAD|nr:ImmA/IrrE family metallo-endopeptidase [Ruania rhizosphaerae]